MNSEHHFQLGGLNASDEAATSVLQQQTALVQRIIHLSTAGLFAFMIVTNSFVIFLIFRARKKLIKVECLILVENCLLLLSICILGVIVSLFDHLLLASFQLCLFTISSLLSSFILVSLQLIYYSLIHLTAFYRTYFVIKLHKLVHNIRAAILYTLVSALASYSFYFSYVHAFQRHIFVSLNETDRDEMNFIIEKYQITPSPRGDHHSAGQRSKSEPVLTCRTKSHAHTLFLFSSAVAPWLILVVIYALLIYLLKRRISLNERTTSNSSATAPPPSSRDRDDSLLACYELPGHAQCAARLSGTPPSMLVATATAATAAVVSATPSSSSVLRSRKARRERNIMLKFLIYSLMSFLICLPMTVQHIIQYFCESCFNYMLASLFDLASALALLSQPLLLVLNHNRLRECFLDTLCRHKLNRPS